MTVSLVQNGKDNVEDDYAWKSAMLSSCKHFVYKVKTVNSSQPMVATLTHTSLKHMITDETPTLLRESTVSRLRFLSHCKSVWFSASLFIKPYNSLLGPQASTKPALQEYVPVAIPDCKLHLSLYPTFDGHQENNVCMTRWVTTSSGRMLQMT